MKIHKHQISVSFPLNSYKKNNINQFKINNFQTERKEKETILLGKKVNINFFKETKISNFEYEEAKKESNNLISSFTYDLFIDFIKNELLISDQKHTYEIFNYIIDTNMDWIIFKKKMNYNTIIEKMKEIKYENLSESQFNFFLNRLAPGKIYPRFIPLSLGMNHIYKWIKTQIIIYIYLINTKQIIRNKLPKINLKTNKSNNNEIISDKKNLHHFKKNISTQNIVLDKNIDNSFPNFQRNYSSNNLDNNLIKLATSKLPINVKMKNQKKKLSESDDEKRYILKTNILSLNGYNAYAEKVKKERSHLSSLPMALTKDYNEMRIFYNINSDGNIIYKNKNENELRNIYSFGIDNKKKIISMLSNNKIAILGNLESKTLKELLK